MLPSISDEEGSAPSLLQTAFGATSLRMSCAARSSSMMAVMLVSARVTDGMIDTSTDPKPIYAQYAALRVHDRRWILGGAHTTGA